MSLRKPTVRHRSALAAALAILAALAASAHGATPREAPAQAATNEAIDPFYLDLERAAEAAAARGDAAGAATRLRRACFGMLEQPARSAACWVRLGLAQAAAGDDDGFDATVERLIVADARLGVWNAAPLTGAERARFEELVVERLPIEVLRGAPAFAGLAYRREQQRVRALPEKERRRELERLAASSDEPRWRLLVAEEELDRGRPQAGLDRLAGLSAAAVGSRVACLRGEALAALARCAAALDAFSGCHPAVEARFAAPALACLRELDRGAEAARLAATLPEEVRADPEVRRRLSALAAPPARPPSPGGPGG